MKGTPMDTKIKWLMTLMVGAILQVSAVNAASEVTPTQYAVITAAITPPVDTVVHSGGAGNGLSRSVNEITLFCVRDGVNILVIPPGYQGGDSSTTPTNASFVDCAFQTPLERSPKGGQSGTVLAPLGGETNGFWEYSGTGKCGDSVFLGTGRGGETVTT